MRIIESENGRGHRIEWESSELPTKAAYESNIETTQRLLTNLPLSGKLSEQELHNLTSALDERLRGLKCGLGSFK
jgi:hypothetical protein